MQRFVHFVCTCICLLLGVGIWGKALCVCVCVCVCGTHAIFMKKLLGMHAQVWNHSLGFRRVLLQACSLPICIITNPDLRELWSSQFSIILSICLHLHMPYTIDAITCSLLLLPPLVSCLVDNISTFIHLDSSHDHYLCQKTYVDN